MRSASTVSNDGASLRGCWKLGVGVGDGLSADQLDDLRRRVAGGVEREEDAATGRHRDVPGG
jgi:hypothetical protein